MAKFTIKNILPPKAAAIDERSRLEFFYNEKYLSLWLNAFEWEGINYQEREFIMREFWSNGRVGAIKLEGSEGSDVAPEGKLVFVPFAPGEFNIYRFPTKANAIRLKGVNFIPTRPLEVDKEIVLGWANVTHKPIVRLIEPFLQRIVDVEMVIRMNLKAQKMPWLIAITPETEKKMRALYDAIESDDPALFVDLDDAEKANALLSGANYIIDKLQDYKLAKENEIREFMGLDNLGFSEKKEHLLTDEIASNNQVTSSSGDCFSTPIEDFCNRIKETFGISISAKSKSEIAREEAERRKEDVESRIPAEEV